MFSPPSGTRSNGCGGAAGAASSGVAVGRKKAPRGCERVGNRSASLVIELTGAAEGVRRRAGDEKLARRLAQLLGASARPGEVLIGRAGPATARAEAARAIFVVAFATGQAGRTCPLAGSGGGGSNLK
jgi:hypothetical protein